LFWENAFSEKGAPLGLANEYGYEHESNGRDGLESRSWDRVFYLQHFDFGGLVNDGQFRKKDGQQHYAYETSIKVWGVFNEGDYNERAEHYLGNIELSLAGTYDNHRLQLTARKRSARLDWYIKTLKFLGGRSGEYYWMIQYFNGYGDSLQRFDSHESVLRAGIAFSH
jgi:phospholipase A1/A2